MNDFADYASEAAHKLLSDNRDFYRAMSRLTVGGRVPDAETVREAMEEVRADERN